MEELKRSLGGLEEQFASIDEDKTPFLQMLHQCIEPPNQILQSLLLENQTIKQDPGHQTDDPEKDSRREEASVPQVKEKRKRKRTRAPKNKEEVENQRMTHIAVERNRRKQMNQHLSSLKSLMPPSFLQRGDQASIVGGAIDFIKELEQLLQSLESQKHKEGTNQENPKTASCSSSTSSHACTTTNSSSISSISTTTTSELDSFTARLGGRETSEVEVTVIQNHVSLKVRCKRGIKGQILKAIVSIEALKLTILHLTISTNFEFVLYSFNLKIEDGCKIASANEIATAVHQIFEQINSEMKWSNLS